jgi:hypothetical protein
MQRGLWAKLLSSKKLNLPVVIYCLGYHIIGTIHQLEFSFGKCHLSGLLSIMCRTIQHMNSH